MLLPHLGNLTIACLMAQLWIILEEDSQGPLTETRISQWISLRRWPSRAHQTGLSTCRRHQWITWEMEEVDLRLKWWEAREVSSNNTMGEMECRYHQRREAEISISNLRMQCLRVVLWHKTTIHRSRGTLSTTPKSGVRRACLRLSLRKTL